MLDIYTQRQYLLRAKQAVGALRVIVLFDLSILIELASQNEF